MVGVTEVELARAYRSGYEYGAESQAYREMEAYQRGLREGQAQAEEMYQQGYEHGVAEERVKHYRPGHLDELETRLRKAGFTKPQRSKVLAVVWEIAGQENLNRLL